MRTTLALLLAISSPALLAGDWYFIPGGTSYHLSDTDYNTSNYGMGMRYDYPEEDGKRAFSMGGFYHNGRSRDSLYGAAGIEYKIQSGLYAGPAAGAITGYKKSIIPAVLPSVSIDYKAIRLNVIWVPKIEGFTPETYMLNLQIKVG